ncbi:MAG: hypothetical protein ACEQSX_00460 [Baekduiaceae bacterium]
MNRAEVGAVVAYLARTYPAVVVPAIDEDWGSALEDVPVAVGMAAARVLASGAVFVGMEQGRITLPLIRDVVAYLLSPAEPIGTYSPSPPPGMIRVLENPRPGKEQDDEPAPGA